MHAMVLVMSLCVVSDVPDFEKKCWDNEALQIEKQIIFSEEEVSTPMQCMMISPGQIAKYIEEHPKYIVRKWKCVPADRLTKGI